MDYECWFMEIKENDLLLAYRIDILVVPTTLW